MVCDLSVWQSVFLSFFFFGVGEMVMDFSLGDFMESPTWAKWEKCKTANLLVVTDAYDVPVSSSAQKG